jgi:hypothetical protein
MPSGARAQQQTPAQPPSPPPAIGPEGMSMPEWQGLSCLWGGVIGGAGVFYYSDVLTAAATGMTNPLLLVPLVATGFLGGCSVGANGAPGLVWLYRKM